MSHPLHLRRADVVTRRTVMVTPPVVVTAVVVTSVPATPSPRLAPPATSTYNAWHYSYAAYNNRSKYAADHTVNNAVHNFTCSINEPGLILQCALHIHRFYNNVLIRLYIPDVGVSLYHFQCMLLLFKLTASDSNRYEINEFYVDLQNTNASLPNQSV